MSKKTKREMNKKVFFLSLLALIFIAMTFLVHWVFIIGAIIIMLINQRELFGKK